eukprot:scaffold47397_cov59-Phaeocystis_antarctica.AAC.2
MPLGGDGQGAKHTRGGRVPNAMRAWAAGASAVAVNQFASLGVGQTPLKAFAVDEAELVAAHDASGPIGHIHRALAPLRVDVTDSQHGTSEPVRVRPRRLPEGQPPHSPKHLVWRDRAMITRGGSFSAVLGVQLLDLADVGDDMLWREIGGGRPSSFRTRSNLLEYSASLLEISKSTLKAMNCMTARPTE